jgi:hypothetical protein
MDVNTAFTSWTDIAGNAGKTIDDFYTFMTTPSLDRTSFLTMFDGNIVIVNNFVARKQYVV